jgi:hypothetical protein
VIHVFTAPYTGAPVTTSLTDVVNCGSVSFTAPSFYFTPGVGRGAGNSTASTAASCGNPALPNVGEAEVGFGLSTANFTTSAGHHNITAVWSLTYDTVLHATGAGSTAGNVLTAGTIEVFSEIYDLTTHGAISFTTWTTVLNTTGNANVNFHGNQTVDSSVNANLTKGQVYTFLTIVEFVTTAEIVAGATSGHASASINMATGGNKATLVSITRT